MTNKTKGGIPMVRLDPSAMPPGDPFDAWHEATAPLFDTRPLVDARSASVACTARHVDDLVLCRVHFAAQVFRRGRRHLASGESDGLLIQLYTKGSLRGDVNGDPLLMAPDRITFHDFSLPYTAHAENSASLGIVIPRHRVTAHDRIRARRPMFGWSLASAKGHLLSSALRALWLGLPRAKAEDARPLAAGFVGLVNGLLATEPSPGEAEAVARATARAMKEYLRANLHRPEIGADDLCRRYRCSRATVYRLFRDVGGVNRFLIDERLKRCLVALTDAGAAQARVRDVAEAWGFDDPAHFSRRFTRAFRMAPSEAKALRRDPAASDDTSRTGPHWREAARLRQWLEQC